jgi:hypothetical protein
MCTCRSCPRPVRSSAAGGWEPTSSTKVTARDAGGDRTRGRRLREVGIQVQNDADHRRDGDENHDHAYHPLAVEHQDTSKLRQDRLQRLHSSQADIDDRSRQGQRSNSKDLRRC